MFYSIHPQLLHIGRQNKHLLVCACDTLVCKQTKLRHQGQGNQFV